MRYRTGQASRAKPGTGLRHGARERGRAIQLPPELREGERAWGGGERKTAPPGLGPDQKVLGRARTAEAGE